MRRLVIWDMLTRDGRFEGEAPRQLALHGLVWGDVLEAFSLHQLDEVGTRRFRRGTFEGMAAYLSEATGPIAERMNAVENGLPHGRDRTAPGPMPRACAARSRATSTR